MFEHVELADRERRWRLRAALVVPVALFGLLSGFEIYGRHRESLIRHFDGRTVADLRRSLGRPDEVRPSARATCFVYTSHTYRHIIEADWCSHDGISLDLGADRIGIIE